MKKRSACGACGLRFKKGRVAYLHGAGTLERKILCAACVERGVALVVVDDVGRTRATLAPFVLHLRKDAELDIVTPYSAGTTIEIGNAGNAALLIPTGDNTPTIAGLYQDHQDTAFAGGPATVLVTVGGAPAAGAGFCIVRYVQTPQAARSTRSRPTGA